MSGESPIQGLEDFSHMRECAETDWVWVWVPVFDDWANGPIPAYKVLRSRSEEYTENREG